jgi:hypothetical protein
MYLSIFCYSTLLNYLSQFTLTSKFLHSEAFSRFTQTLSMTCQSIYYLFLSPTFLYKSYPSAPCSLTPVAAPQPAP